MPLPRSIQALIDAAKVAVEADSQHALDPLHRLAIYEAFSDTEAATAPCWLAVVTAQRMLPIFQQHYPDDHFPEELLTTALNIMQGTEVEPAVLENMLDQGHHASAGAWGYDEHEIPWPVWLAGNTAYHALSEVAGYLPLRNLPDYYKGDVLTKWTDQDLCEYPYCDTAGAAAIASASDCYGQSIDPAKQLAFWRWWLTDAMVIAYRSASQGKLP